VWRRMSALAALGLVLLPIGGGSYVAEANGIPAIADVSLAASPGWIPEPAGLVLLFLNVAWLIVRCRRLPSGA